jgi:glutamate-1-semialdehyde aminotransferase
MKRDKHHNVPDRAQTKKLPMQVDRAAFATRLRETICEAIASHATEEKMWTTVRRIQLYFEKYSELDAKKVEKHLPAALEDLLAHGVLVKKNHAFTFLSAETSHCPRARTRKRADPAAKTLAPDVVVTSSGRVSYRTAT